MRRLFFALNILILWALPAKSFGAPLCVEGFKEPHFYHGRLHFLQVEARKSFDWQIRQDIADGFLMNAARRAEDLGYRDLSYLITKTMKEIFDSSPIKKGYPKLIKSDKGEVYLVEFTSGVKAIFKPGGQAEVAAYRLAYIFGLQSVPFTAMRTINGVRGSLQAFIKEGEAPSSPVRPNQANLNPLVRQVADLFIFDAVIRNLDRSDINMIFFGHKVWGIDHLASFHRGKEDPLMDRPLDPNWSQALSLSFAAGLKATTPEMIRHQLDGLLKPRLIEDVISRHRQILANLPANPNGRR